MSLQKKMYGLPDSLPSERPLEPPGERAELVCEGCGGRLYSSGTVRVESLFLDVVGCELCSEWAEPDSLERAPWQCPNCGEAVEDGALLLVSEGGLPLACDLCATDTLAALACRPAEADEGLFWGFGAWGQAAAREPGRPQGARRALQPGDGAGAGPDGGAGHTEGDGRAVWFTAGERNEGRKAG